MTTDQDADRIDPLLRRLERKLEILHLDLRSAGNMTYHDIRECMVLLQSIQREIAAYRDPQ